ncbi:MAG: hypothetical protein PHG42_08215 [Bacteroides sp.]|nr:hypothetical protein [Fermentimonas sp.]MDD4055756.1 hypothetical protein [Bacteroides sp.]MDD4804319.1 hypothetical protein [Candidatus Paceibacterota bacterium]
MKKEDIETGIVAGLIVTFLALLELLCVFVKIAIKIIGVVIPWVILAMIVIWVLRAIGYVPW